MSPAPKWTSCTLFGAALIDGEISLSCQSTYHTREDVLSAMQARPWIQTWLGEFRYSSGNVSYRVLRLNITVDGLD